MAQRAVEYKQVGYVAQKWFFTNGPSSGYDIPIAGAEREYTRWGFRCFLDASAVDVLQPDI